MRLDTPTHFADQGEKAGIVTQLSQGPGLWTLYFFMLWLNTTFLAALIHNPSRVGPDRVPWTVGSNWSMPIAAWTIGLGVTAWLACRSRISVHDMLVELGEKERLGLGIVLLSIFFLPALTRDSHVIPDGFLWVSPFMMMMAVYAHLARRMLAWNLLGAWFAAFHVQETGGLVILLGFGGSWLMALGVHHFAFTGEAHGLGGWWPTRKVIDNALLTSIPATLAGALAWRLWPRGRLRTPAYARFFFSPDPAHPQRIFDQLGTVDRMAILWRGLACVFFTAILLIALIYIRRLFLKRQRMALDGDILPGQVARLTYHVAQAAPATPELAGRRGKIVKLWGRWATMMEREGFGRLTGETAAQYAQRLGRDYPEASPPAVMTNLLEQAHYGKEEPSRADLESMRQYVLEEISRLSLLRQKPIESIDLPES